jgi:hypothetical protein
MMLLYLGDGSRIPLDKSGIVIGKGMGVLHNIVDKNVSNSHVDVSVRTDLGKIIITNLAVNPILVTKNGKTYSRILNEFNKLY